MVLGARLRTVMSSIIRWRKAEILPAGGTEYAEGLLLLMRATVMENPVERHVGDSGNQVGVTTRRSWQPNATRRVSTLRNNGLPGNAAPALAFIGSRGHSAPLLRGTPPRCQAGVPAKSGGGGGEACMP